MRILVTGGAGFIGTNLVSFLLTLGHQVTIVDNLSTGNIGNIRIHKGNSNLRFLNCCVIQLEDYLTEQYDQIYHLACPASPSKYQRDPLQTLNTCYLGSLAALKVAEQQHSRILLTSTSEIYGEPAMHPQPENYNGNVNPIGIRACYDEGKRVSETLFTEYNRCRKVDIRIARIFNTYGPHMDADDGRVVTSFLHAAINDVPITIFGSGKQTRSLCYVTDTILGLYALMNYDGSDQHSPYNIGNDHEFSINEIAEHILILTGSKSGLTYKTLPADDPTRRCPDINKSAHLLGWSPRIDFKEGVQMMLDHIRNKDRDAI